MMQRWRSLFMVAVAILWAGCSGSSNPTCDNTGGQPLAKAPWPKFHHDNSNSGRVGVDLSGNTGTVRWVFPPDSPTGSFSFTSAAVVSTTCSGTSSPCSQDSDCTTGTCSETDNARVFIGSTDGTFYALKTDGTQDPDFANRFDNSLSDQRAAFTGSPAVSADGTLYAATESNLVVINPDGSIKNQVILGGLGSATTLASDGTAYVGASTTGSTGLLLAVCVNTINRWTFIGTPATGSAAVGPDGTVYFTSASTIQPALRALAPDTGQPKWEFDAATPIRSAPVLEVVTAGTTDQVQTIYVGDTATNPTTFGRLYAINPGNGSRKLIDGVPFAFPVSTGSSIVAAPALGFPRTTDNGTIVDTVYVAATDGRLYAVDTATARARAIFETAGALSDPVQGIRSAPVVACDRDPNGDGTTTIVFGSDDGNVYRVIDDDEPCRPDRPGPPIVAPTPGTLREVWRTSVSAPVGASSAAIGPDGTVYIGTTGAQVFAIGSAS
jgi:PQQ-like domain